MKVYVVFYSMYGHVWRLAEAVAEGASQVVGADVRLWRVAEIASDEELKKRGADVAQKQFAHVPVIQPEQLAEADAILFGTPTRFGNMAAAMARMWDQTTKLWLAGGLIGKVGSVFVSTASQHGGQETTISNIHTTLLHHGMIVVGVPYSCKDLVNMTEITGGSPYGATTLADADGSRLPSENELAIARFQGRHVAEIAKRLVAGG
ncbi:MAG: NAD(P)H:quinone oxidoreductase [Pirellulales bacterium]|nr:NAD(P)H:quinone oxidoreductase [Pirellulales bacterium]